MHFLVAPESKKNSPETHLSLLQKKMQNFNSSFYKVVDVDQTIISKLTRKCIHAIVKSDFEGKQLETRREKEEKNGKNKVKFS